MHMLIATAKGGHDADRGPIDGHPVEAIESWPMQWPWLAERSCLLAACCWLFGQPATALSGTTAAAAHFLWTSEPFGLASVWCRVDRGTFRPRCANIPTQRHRPNPIGLGSFAFLNPDANAEACRRSSCRQQSELAAPAADTGNPSRCGTPIDDGVSS